MSENFYEFLSSRFHADDICIETASGETFTYNDLDEMSASLASKFSELGVETGDRVMVQVEKSAQNVFAYFAALRAGFIYLPLNTAYQTHELEYFVADASPTLIICDPEKEELFSRIAPEAATLTLDASGGGTLMEDLPETRFSPTDNISEVAVILYTSGTTGQPKGAMITHANLIANASALHEAWAFSRDDVLLHALPIFHIHGLFVATHLAVMSSARMLFLSRFEPKQVIDRLPRSTVYMGVPTNYVRLLAEPGFDRDACSNMRLFTSGSAPLLVQTFDEFKIRTGHNIVERYGMTETGMNTSNPLEGEKRPGTVGPPLPGVETKIVNDEGDELPDGETGVLCVRGPNVFKGYWNKPEKTAEDFDAEGYFRTGDLSTADEDGYISIVGRSKDLIITGGLNVYPKEIEGIIDKLPGVTESAVIGLPHDDFGEAVTAIVVADEDALSDQVIIDHMKKTVANFKVPKAVHFVDELPRNTMGKVQKNVLRETFGS